MSVLRHIRAALPHEDLLYFADSGFAPYGDKPESAIRARSFRIVDFLLERQAKAIVVACNSATAAAIAVLRQHYPRLPIIGIEPGLKPAALLSNTRIVGVLATKSTLASNKFTRLHERVTSDTRTLFLLQGCSGLADRIENGELASEETSRLIRHYVAPLIIRGADTLVLGCTHYPFVQPAIDECIRQIDIRPVRILDTGEPVTRQLLHLLIKNGLERSTERRGVLLGFTTGSERSLERAFSDLLHVVPPIKRIPDAD